MKKNLHSPAQLERIETGVQRLDAILKGGFIKGGTYVVMGPPGSGKTIFANQISFNHVRTQNGNCIYLTLLGESHGKMMTHLSTLNFFDNSLIGERIFYMSGYGALKEEGLTGLLKLIRETMKRRKASLLIIDGIQAAHKRSATETDFAEFLHELQAYSNILRCTNVLLTPNRRLKADDVESVVVDGVIEMSYQLVGPRAVRELTVHKFRGTDFLLGKHETEITSDGLQIHPRTEIQFDQPHEDEGERIRMAFGISKLDEMLEGGLMSGSSIVLLGAPGTGKTMLGLSFLIEGAKRGQKGIYFGFYEPPSRLIAKAEILGVNIRKYIDQGLIEFIWQPPLEHFMDALAEQLLEKIKGEKLPNRRLFIDGVEGFRTAAIYPERLPRFLSSLTNQLRMTGVTTLVTEELDLYKSDVEMPTPELASVAEGVILVRYLELNSQIHRLISILKMRESAYDTSIREFMITKKGISVSDSFLSAESVLSGQATLIAGKAPSKSLKTASPKKKVKASTTRMRK